MCSTGAVESEIHFLLHCPFYANERMPILDALETKHSGHGTINEEDQMKLLMNFEPRLSARFILSAFIKRKFKLYI